MPQAPTRPGVPTPLLQNNLRSREEPLPWGGGPLKKVAITSRVAPPRAAGADGFGTATTFDSDMTKQTDTSSSKDNPSEVAPERKTGRPKPSEGLTLRQAAAIYFGGLFLIVSGLFVAGYVT